ncbi:MAG: hypothetical protein ACTHLX_06285 [Candidatus Binatia bacterium]
MATHSLWAMPLALAIGQCAAMQQPLAIAIVSRLVAQLPLVLIVLPALLLPFGVGRRHGNRVIVDGEDQHR